MEKQFVTTSESPQVLITVGGSLRLKGTDTLEVIAKTENSDNLSLEQQGESIVVNCASDCMVRVPRQAIVKISCVNGNAIIKGLEGELTITEVDGNLTLRNAGPVNLDKVMGEISAKHVDGDFKINEVNGNAVVSDVQGCFNVASEINGNLKLDDVEGCAKAKVNGNITLRLDPAPGEKYEFEADDNLLCRLPVDASVKVHVTRAGGSIKVDFKECEKSSEGMTCCEMTLGEGDSDLTLSAGGNVIITHQAPDWEMSDNFDADLGSEFEGMANEIGEQVSRQVEAHMEMLEKQMEAQMSHLSTTLGSVGLSAEAAERVAQRAREAGERAAARAQERMQRAQERMQRKMEAAKRKAEQHAHFAERHTRAHERRSWEFQWPGSSPESVSEPVSDDERMVILRMLEEKKISLEQAEALLAALEGK